jgi:ATP-dependent RNA circularization protein (DNA/RNA ligase family)
MSEYHKIQSIFKRNLNLKHKPLIEGDYTLPEFEYLAHNQWMFTEKVDGTNIRIIIANDTITFGGRTEAAQIPAQLLNRLNEKFLPLKDQLLAQFPDGGILYGEGYGNKIQKVGHCYRPDQDFVLFDVKVNEWWLKRPDIEAVAQSLALDIVPIIGTGTLIQAVEWAKAGIKSTWGDFEAEGIVARNPLELTTRAGKRLITKIKCGDFKKLA